MAFAEASTSLRTRRRPYDVTLAPGSCRTRFFGLDVRRVQMLKSSRRRLLPWILRSSFLSPILFYAAPTKCQLPPCPAHESLAAFPRHRLSAFLIALAPLVLQTRLAFAFLRPMLFAVLLAVAFPLPLCAASFLHPPFFLTPLDLLVFALPIQPDAGTK